MRKYRIQTKIDELKEKLATLQGEERREALSQLMQLEGMRRTKAGRKE